MGQWSRNSLNVAFQRWMNDAAMKENKALPCLVVWVRYGSLETHVFFKVNPLTPLEVFHSIKKLYKDLKQPGVQKAPQNFKCSSD